MRIVGKSMAGRDCQRVQALSGLVPRLLVFVVMLRSRLVDV